jgi:hypothetical protein
LANIPLSVYSVSHYLASGLTYLLLLAYVAEDEVNVVLEADRGREGLICRFLEDILFPKGN